MSYPQRLRNVNNILQIILNLNLRNTKPDSKSIRGTFAAFAREIIHNIPKKTQRSDIYLQQTLATVPLHLKQRHYRRRNPRDSRRRVVLSLVHVRRPLPRRDRSVEFLLEDPR
ncbi:MAG TPA: hypothetical protein VIQ53_00080 [Inquilinus sp.]